ncbi:MAG: DEDD exonuclease domain-containing protein [Candidatus Nanopelagicales bacterium]|jgi:DNA polymerase-3 subunit epsilon|nr:DEDD exonuclease domain-containing protein [Candidatus Nanopelagicales bacterium]
MSAVAKYEAPPGEQLDLDLEGELLAGTTFCVVDLETTGGSPSDGRITEIGAVKVRGGEVLGEFRTFVDPGQTLPAFITVLTGITDRMLSGAPQEGDAVPLLLEFMAGSVFVAHNAPYDTGFLKAACDRLGLHWPNPHVIDTARLARSLLGRDEVANHKLGTLAAYFHASVQPSHRALDDARATVDVLHGLIERLGTAGVFTVEELATSMRKVPRQRRDKRHLADRLPEGPGVYVFRDAQDRPLYVGVSRDIRRRVRSYFTSAEQRPRMTEMVSIAQTVTAVRCATDLEARVRELRLIAQWKPPYNRRSRHPEKNVWLKLTREAFPRLSVVRSVAADEGLGAVYIGPLSSRSDAHDAAAAITEATGLRACTQSIRPGRRAPGCVLAEIGRCSAPCQGTMDPAAYTPTAARTRDVMLGKDSALESTLAHRMKVLAEGQRFEQAALWRDRLEAALRARDGASELRVFAQIPQIVAAASRTGGWDIHVIRHGRMAAAGFCPTNGEPRTFVQTLIATAEHVAAPAPPDSAALVAETRMILRWLDDARPVAVDGQWALPIRPSVRK